MEQIIFGHKNPDTDTICSSIAYSMYLNKLGFNTKAIRIGEINNETSFVLDYINFEKPEFMDKVDDNQDVILVDHNEFNQSIDNIENANIIEVIDHHRVNNFNTNNPINMTVRSVGCTSTIIYDLIEDKTMICSDMAILMMSAIISDTLLLKSPTTTDKDIEVLEKLSKIANVDYKDYGIKMLKEGTDFGDKKGEDLICIDSKVFKKDIGDIEVAQINTVDIKETLSKYEEGIRAGMIKAINEKGLKLFIVMVTDILNSNSEAIVLGDEVNYFEKQFNVTVENNKVLLEGVVSRKKQIIPNL